MSYQWLGSNYKHIRYSKELGVDMSEFGYPIHMFLTKSLSYHKHPIKGIKQIVRYGMFILPVFDELLSQPSMSSYTEICGYQ